MDNTFGIDIIPENDKQRIEVLKRYKILNTPPEHTFDNVAKLAAQLFDVPIALISLVDIETVYFKANIGMGNVKSSPRGTSLCSLAILQPEVTVFEDAARAECLLANPLVAGEFGLKFYAGAPLITHDGFLIGTVCVVDKSIRKFTKKEEELLKGLAKIVMDEIELRFSAIEEAEKQKSIYARLLQSESKARHLISDAPVAIGVLTGRDLIVESANAKILELWGKTGSIINQPLHQALPEIQGQPFLKILDDVFTSGEAFYGNELKAQLYQNGQLNDLYFNFVYHPVKDDQGNTISITVVAIDVTELILSRNESEFNKHRLESMVMTAHTGMTVLKGRDLVIEIANEPMYKIWNRTADQVLGKRLMDIFPELIDQPFPKMLNDIFNTGKELAISEIEAEISTELGSKHIYIDFKYAPLFDKNGDVEAIMATVFDITDNVIARRLLEESEEEQQALNEELSTTVEELAASNEEMLTTNEELAVTYENLKSLLNKLAESEGRFRGMIEQAPVAILLLRGENLLLEIMNPTMQLLIGKGPEFIGQPIKAIFPEIAKDPIIDIIEQVYQTGKPYYGFETPVTFHRNNDLETGYFNYAYTPLFENGVTTGVLQVVTEVTSEVKNRAELQRAEEMLRFSVEAANLGIWFINTKTLDFITSPNMKKFFGYHPDQEMSYEAAVAQITDEYREKVLEAVNGTISNGEAYNIDYPVIGFHDQKLRWLRTIGKSEYNSKGEVSHFSGVAFEITEQKLDEIRKNDFIAMVSHELKTPLTSLKGYMQLLTAKNKKDATDFTTIALEKGNNQVKKMTAMIDGFLNISQFEAGKIHLEKSTFQLDQLIKNAVDDTKMISNGYQIIFSPAEPIYIKADQEKIGQVITNLMSNAIKYSPQGKCIWLSCKESKDNVQISVKDEGMGIKPEDVENLFKRFYRVSDFQNQNISGFGIGLYLCAEIINRHNGEIWVESEIGKGSTFHFSLPKQ